MISWYRQRQKQYLVKEGSGTMIQEIIDEAIDLFGDMPAREILKEVFTAAGFFALMVAIIILVLGVQPI